MKSPDGVDPRLYELFPTKEPRPAGELEKLEKVWAAPKGLGFLTAVNNNFIGVYYVAASFLFFLLAGILALVIRVQLALPLQGVLSQETYNQFFTMHGTVMMFLFAVPAVEALGVLLLPQMLAARDLPFPRLSAYAFWAYLVGGLCFFASIFVGLAPSGGWFMYPPLTSTAYSPGINADFWLLGIGFIEISAIAGAIEIIVGVLKTRAPGMTLDKMPIYAWTMLVFAVMILIAFPAIIFATLALELERAFNWPFFDPTRGGDPLLWQHLFWFFGHPEVYIIFLPGAGLVSMMVAALSGTPLVGYRLIVLALIATAFISFGVWAHHMFTTGMPRLSVGLFSAASMAVSVPAGIQVFSWIATLAIGRPRYNAPTLFLVGGLVIFVMGGLTGVMVAMVPFNWQVHDTHFIVAHLHYVLIGGMVFPFFAALYYWTPMTSTRPLSDRLGCWAFWVMFIGMHVTFLPMHLTGMMGMPRRVYTYLEERNWELPNLLSTAGAVILTAGILIVLVDLALNFRFTVNKDAGNRYGGGTLDWLPTGLYSGRSIPVVRSREPLWDQPDLARDVEEGRYLLPGSATGHRETLITDPLYANPQYLQIMPGPSAWPLFGAIFTAGFFLLLTVQAYTASAVSGVLAIACILAWLWETDYPVAPDEVDIGGGIRVPTYATGPATHGWWAMVCLMIVMGMIFLMALFSHAYLFGLHRSFWMSAPSESWLPVLLAGYGGASVLALLGRYILARPGTRLWPPAVTLLCAAGLLAASWAADLTGWLDHGLRGDASGQGATVSIMLALQGLVVAIGIIMALYMAARTSRGRVTRPRNNSFDLVTLFLCYAGAQGVVGTLAARLVAGAG